MSYDRTMRVPLESKVEPKEQTQALIKKFLHSERVGNFTLIIFPPTPTMDLTLAAMS